MKDENRDCGTCKYFNSYYLKLDTRYRKTGEGVCTNPGAIAARGRKKFKKRTGCDFWQPQVSEQKNICAIEEVLRDMERHLASIKEILFEEDE